MGNTHRKRKKKGLAYCIRAEDFQI